LKLLTLPGPASYDVYGVSGLLTSPVALLPFKGLRATLTKFALRFSERKTLS
jgi:hypothetical protein